MKIVREGTPQSFGWMKTTVQTELGFDVWEDPEGEPMFLPPYKDIRLRKRDGQKFRWFRASKSGPDKRVVV